MIFVIDRRDVVLRYQSGSIRLEVNERLIQRVPVNQLALVVVYGNPLSETAVWRQLAAANVPTVMLNLRGKSQVAVIGSGLATQLPLRIKQHQIAGDETLRLKLAKWIVDKKITGYGIPFSMLNEHHQINTEMFSSQIKKAQQNLAKASSNNGVMGVEGHFAQVWFKIMSEYLPVRWNFTGRNRRPPKDPVNALLSLSYTLMIAEVRQHVIGFGFDPALGFLHQDVPGRESLVLDVAELFRAGVDGFVLQCLEQKLFTPKSFYYRDQTGCLLSKQARADYFRAWAIYRGNWPKPQLADEGELQTTVLREQITGQLMQLRKIMNKTGSFSSDDEPYFKL